MGNDYKIITEDNDQLDIGRELEDYFNHKPAERFVGVALLNEDQIQQIYDGDDITDEVDLMGVIKNQDIKE